MNKSTLKICVIVPAYNEEKIIQTTIRHALDIFEKEANNFLVVVINDGSNDKTAEYSKRAGATVIEHILNTGAGGATATGLSYAEQNSFDIAVTMDADGQHDPKDVINGVNMLIKSGADLLIGSRLIEDQGMSKTKTIGNKGLSFITYLLFGVYSTDSQSGLRVFSQRSLQNLRWRTSGYEFCSEMLWRAKQAKLIINEYPIKSIYTSYSKGKGQNNWNGFNIVKSLIRQRLSELLA